MMGGMDNTRYLRLNIGATGQGSVEIDGKDVSGSVAGVTLNAHVGEPTTALLRLAPGSVGVDADAVVHLPAEVEQLLVAAGWTPPAEG